MSEILQPFSRYWNGVLLCHRSLGSWQAPTHCNVPVDFLQIVSSILLASSILQAFVLFVKKRKKRKIIVSMNISLVWSAVFGKHWCQAHNTWKISMAIMLMRWKSLNKHLNWPWLSTLVWVLDCINVGRIAFPFKKYLWWTRARARTWWVWKFWNTYNVHSIDK